MLEAQIYEIRTKDPDAIVIVTGDLNVHLGDKQTASAAADWPRNSPCTTQGDKRTAKRLLAALDADKANMVLLNGTSLATAKGRGYTDGVGSTGTRS